MSLSESDFRNPAISLAGTVDYAMYVNFKSQLANAPTQGLVVVELSTLGGDPEVARMMGEDIRFASAQSPSRQLVFLGKAAIYSAGTTFMSFFLKQNRYLTRGTRLMVHERKIAKTIALDGPLTTSAEIVKAALNEIECSIAIQNEGFANLIIGSDVTMPDIMKHATANWYLEAREALDLNLIEGVI